MSYLLEFRQSDGMVAQRIDDKETLWIVLEAMLDGDCPMEVLVSKLNDRTECRKQAALYDKPLSEDEIWTGKWESKE